MKKVKIHRLYTALLLAALIAPPMVAQERQNSRRNDNYTPTKKGTPGYYDQKVRQMFKQGDWEGGKTLLDEGLAKYQTVSGLNELMGSYWLHHKDYDKARYFLIRSLRDDNKNPQSLQMLMKIEEETKHYSSAIVYCNELLEQAPYEYTLWRKKIELFRLQGNEVEAARMLKRLGEIYPDRMEVKKEIAWDYEEKYRKYRKDGDIAGQEEMLRNLVKLSPKDAEFQMALCNLLLNSGRTGEAIDVAGYAATIVSQPYPFVEKKASILGDLSRYDEALSYLRSVQRGMPALASHRMQLARLISNLEKESANVALRNDAYTAYAKLYEREHSEEALTYLLNTSMSRGYLDDALVYIREARRRHGDTQNLLYREYTVLRRLGYTNAAVTMLENIHTKWPDDVDVNNELCGIRMDDVRRMMDFGQYDDAIPTLERIREYKVDDDTHAAIERRLFTCYVKAGQRAKALTQLERISNDPLVQAGLLEEVELPFIKELMAQGRMHQAEAEIQKVLELGEPSADILRMAITTAMVLKKNNQARVLVDIGQERFPEDPYFILKDAQLKAGKGDFETALNLLKPMLDTYSGDNAVIDAYADCSEALAMKHLKEKNFDEAMRLVDDGLVYSPNSQTLILAKSMIYEAKKDWENAIETYREYHPAMGELREYKLRMEALRRHLMKNQLLIDYQRARPSDYDGITSAGTITYTRYAKINAYSLSMTYAGRDGLIHNTANTDSIGGTGFQVTGEWQHEWNSRFTTNLTVGGANKFFPRVKVGLAGSYSLRNDWTAKGDVSYRLIGPGDKANTSLIGLGVGATKEIDHFSFGADAHAFAMMGKQTDYFGGKFFVSGGLVAKCYPFDGSRTHLFLSGSVGTAPDLSVIDNTMPTKFNQLNTMLNFGGMYVVNSVLDFGLSGLWYTMTLDSSSAAQASYSKNYLYFNANVTIHF